MEKYKSLNIFLAFCFALVFSVFCFGCDNEKQKTQAEILNVVIQNTNLEIENIDQQIMSGNQSSVASIKTYSHINMDRGCSEQAYVPVRQMTISFGYYALSEIFLEKNTELLEKTLFVEQDYYPNQEIFCRVATGDGRVDVFIGTNYQNVFDEFIDITVFYDKETLKPTKFIQREDRSYYVCGEHFGKTEVDFQNNRATVEILNFESTEFVDYRTADSNTIKSNITRYINEQFSFSDYKNRVTKFFEDRPNSISEEEMMEYVSNFDFVLAKDKSECFDFENQINFERGNDAMDECFDKYLILENKETGELTRVRNNA